MHPEEKDSLTRRQVVGGLAVTAAAVVAPSAFGQDESVRPQTNPQSLMSDPTTRYARPPFPAQSQTFPGLASKMVPKPDHGEESYRGSGRLLGRKALITGGDSGIGRAAAIAYAREGADVAINYLPAEEPDAQEVIALIRAAGRKGVAIPGDLREESFCKRLVDTAAKELGGLDIVVNNAARQQAKPSIMDVTSEEFDATFKTNVYAPFWIVKAAMPYLKPGATILITTSEQAYDPSPQIGHYAQTKAANASLAKSLAKELAPKGIRVNGVAPGPFWTPLQVSGGALPEKLPTFGADKPLGRPGQPAELAAVFVLLASGESSYATGQVYGATGGEGQP